MEQLPSPSFSISSIFSDNGGVEAAVLVDGEDGNTTITISTDGEESGADTTIDSIDTEDEEEEGVTTVRGNVNVIWPDSSSAPDESSDDEDDDYVTTAAVLTPEERARLQAIERARAREECARKKAAELKKSFTMWNDSVTEANMKYLPNNRPGPSTSERRPTAVVGPLPDIAADILPD